MPLKQLFLKQTTLTELTNTNTSRLFEKKIKNKFILVFKQNSFLLRMGEINQKFYCDTSVTIRSIQPLVKYENKPHLWYYFCKKLSVLRSYLL